MLFLNFIFNSLKRHSDPYLDKTLLVCLWGEPSPAADGDVSKTTGSCLTVKFGWPGKRRASDGICPLVLKIFSMSLQ